MPSNTPSTIEYVVGVWKVLTSTFEKRTETHFTRDGVVNGHTFIENGV